MISVLHLVWIIPVSAVFGMLILAVLFLEAEYWAPWNMDEEDKHHDKK